MANKKFVTVADGGKDTRSVSFDEAHIPSAGQKAALPGTNGTPGDANRYVTSSDPRNTDTRNPTMTQVTGDWNDVLVTGMFQGTGLANQCPGDSWRFCSVMRHNDAWISQTMNDFNGTGMYHRNKVNGTWGSWRKLDTTESASIPVGTVLNWPAGSSLPTGFLWWKGQALNVTTYADLYAVIGDHYGRVGDDFYLGRDDYYRDKIVLEPINGTSRNWTDITVALNGDIYACDTLFNHQDIYKQSGGTGTFDALGAPGLWWRSMTASRINGNIYAGASNNYIHMQSEGTGSFNSLGGFVRVWAGMTATANGDIYAAAGDASTYDGIYVQSGGIGPFVRIHAGGFAWRGMTTAPNGDVYACAAGNYIYMQSGGAGSFVSLGGATRSWQGMTATLNGDIYASVYGGDIYMQSGGIGPFTALGGATRNWQGMATAANGDIYATVYGGDIYKSLNQLLKIVKY